MMTVSVGTDTYGRVKNVAGTPIVTKFAMLEFLPLYPLQSFYCEGTIPGEAEGSSFIVRRRTTAVAGIPLRSVDKTSVTIAYLRGLFAAMVLAGTTLLVPAIGYFNGQHLDEFATMAVRYLGMTLVVGIVGGALSYAIPLTPRREKDIRRYCSERLGIAVDPARVPHLFAAILAERARRQPLDPTNPREQLVQQLIIVRSKIVQEEDTINLEAETDKLLDDLNHLARISIETTQ